MLWGDYHYYAADVMPVMQLINRRVGQHGRKGQRQWPKIAFIVYFIIGGWESVCK